MAGEFTSEDKKVSFFRRYAPELRVCFLYSVILIIVMCFHEPWFDELQAWLIARDASAYDLVFKIPHYEGHTCLWWFLLKATIAVGMPCEIGLKSLQFVFAAAAVAVLEFRSPFPKKIKCLLPFLYWLLYQYGVISRLYAIAVLALFLAASFWKMRNEKPWRFCLSLLLLAATCAYGLAIAGGIAGAWVLEIVVTDRSLKGLFLHRRRLSAMAVLLACAIGIALMIFPAKDAAASVFVVADGWKLAKCLFYFLFVVPSETFVSAFSGDVYLTLLELNVGELLSALIVSACIWLTLCILARRRKLLHYLLLPYALFGIVASRYIVAHHFGMVFAVFLFFVWVALETAPLDISAAAEKCKGRLSFLIRPIACAAGALVLVIGLAWSVAACVVDIRYTYGSGKTVAQYIEENDLQNLKWLIGWTVYETEDGEERTDYNLLDADYICVNAYLKEPLQIVNTVKASYKTHVVSPEDDTAICAEMKEAGEPDILFGAGVYQTSLKEKFGWTQTYYPVKAGTEGTIIRGEYKEKDVLIYATREVIETYGLEVYGESGY